MCATSICAPRSSGPRPGPRRRGRRRVARGAPCLRYKGAYGQLAYRLSNWLSPYARVDWRDARHRDGASFVYESHVLRATGGLRAELGAHHREGRVHLEPRARARRPQFRDDVFTSSLVDQVLRGAMRRTQIVVTGLCAVALAVTLCGDAAPPRARPAPSTAR